MLYIQFLFASEVLHENAPQQGIGTSLLCTCPVAALCFASDACWNRKKNDLGKVRCRDRDSQPLDRSASMHTAALLLHVGDSFTTLYLHLDLAGKNLPTLPAKPALGVLE